MVWHALAVCVCRYMDVYVCIRMCEKEIYPNPQIARRETKRKIEKARDPPSQSLSAPYRLRIRENGATRIGWGPLQHCTSLKCWQYCAFLYIHHLNNTYYCSFPLNCVSLPELPPHCVPPSINLLSYFLSSPSRVQSADRG